jgi:fucose 4-O-acetylase-like acetyltransferase
MNDQRSFAMTAWVGFCYSWGMPLFFLICGAGARFSLRARGSGPFVAERFRRLIIPYVMGVALLIPVQGYLEQVSRHQFQGSYLQFYPHFFANARIGWNLHFNLWPSHLWFLRYLFEFSVLALPLFLGMQTPTGQRLVARLAGFCEHRGAIVLWVIPITLVEVSLRAGFPGYGDWADFFYWSVFFVYGGLVVSDPRFEDAVQRHGAMALATGTACFAALGVLYYAGFVEPWENTPAYSLEYMFYEALCSLNTWVWVLGILYLGMRFLDFTDRWLVYSNEAVLPFYVLHHTVVIVVAFYVVPWNTGILPKYLVIVAASLAVLFVVYELLVRRINALRFLIGMRPKKRLLQSQVASTPG